MKIAILTTSDIQKLDFRDNSLRSTGVLESLLENDYQVYVVSSRTSFGEHDYWWMGLLQEYGGKVFQPKRPVYSANDIDLIALWARMYEIVDRKLLAPEFSTWMDLQEDLSNQGILTGRAVYDYKKKIQKVS